jgi:hypothetical protein
MASDQPIPETAFKNASSIFKGRMGEAACDSAMHARGYQTLFSNHRFFGVEIDRVYSAGNPVGQILFAEIKVIDVAGGFNAAAKLQDFLRARATGPQTIRQRHALERSTTSFLRSYPLALFAHVLICVDRSDVANKGTEPPRLAMFDLGTGAEIL